MIFTFRTIAKYERKILMRSWFFRIFSVLSLFVLFAFNMGEISEVGDMEWVYRAIPANLPYANLFILNVAQAIIAVFLSSEFIKRDRKQDTTEVFYVRSMSNATYLFGKVWSILSIFLLINVVALLMALVFNLLAKDTYVDWQAYLYYPLLISVPTLTFIVGLSIFLMGVIRNQALTFVLLLGYILSSLIYLRGSHNYLFDYMAFYLPLFHSELVGFGDWPTILSLRVMYTCLGLGFMFFSILISNRLPQSRLINISSFMLGVLAIGSALYLGHQHLKNYQEHKVLSAEMIALNNSYISHAQIDIEDHEIRLEQNESDYKAVSRIKGYTETAASEFVFTLNPGLKVISVSSIAKELEYERKLQLLIVRFDTILPIETSIELRIEYQGTIDENACYLDIDEKLKSEKKKNYLFDIGSRYAFIHPQYLLLTPEAQWYPQSGVGYSNASPFWYRKDFVNYQLTIKTLPGLIPISQGHPTQLEENTYFFERDYGLPQLSVAIGNYKRTTLDTDSMKFSLYYIDGHDYFNNAFQDIRDTLPSIIEERLRDFERQSGLKYPFDKFTIIEVPGQFKTYDRNWTSVHQTIQPGQVLIPEKGLYTRNLDFNGSVKRRKRWNRRRNKTAEELQIEVLHVFLEEFYRFKNINTNFNAGRAQVEETLNPYYQFGQLYEMCNNLDSKDWPVLNRVFESYLRIENNRGRDWMRQTSGSTQNELANMVLQEKSFAQILNLSEHQSLIDNVIELKGEMLFSMIQAIAKTDRFREYVIQLLQEYRFKNLKFAEFQKHIYAEFGVDLSQHMTKWFNETDMAQYLFSTPVAEKVLVGNREMNRVRFKISNLGTTGGVVKSKLRPGDTQEKLIYLEPGQTKEAFYLSLTEPAGIHFNTLTSGNLPNQIDYSFEVINKTKVTNAVEKQEIVANPLVIVNDNEIIVDNENPSFEFTHFEEVSRLRKWLKAEVDDDFKYQGTMVWRAPLNWTATTNDRFFGEFIRSAFYIKAGDGSKEAKWNIPISEPGRYDVFYHVYKDDSFNWNRGQKGNYQFVIPHANGIDRPSIELSHQSPGGWNSLGDYVFTADTATITLSNESRLRAIFADAIKLVKMD